MQPESTKSRRLQAANYRNAKFQPQRARVAAGGARPIDHAALQRCGQKSSKKGVIETWLSVQFGFNRLTRLFFASFLTLLWCDGAVALDRKLVHPFAHERELRVDHQIRRGPDEALPRHYRAVATSELGVEETVDARSLNNLAMVYHDQGRYAEAEPLYQRSEVTVR